MAVAHRVIDSNGNPIGWAIECPACGHGHCFNVEQPTRGGARWTFNGDTGKPTFHPSMVASWTSPNTGQKHVCHSWVRDGQIQFLGDCTHAMAGQTVDLPDMDKE